MFEKIRKFITPPIIMFIIITSIFLIYYAGCYYKNNILVFKRDDSVILLGFCIMNFLTMFGFIFVVLGDSKIIKEVHKLQKESNLLQVSIAKRDEKIEELINIIIEQNEENCHDNLLAHRRTKELILDN